jgi:hypothetical protein
MSAPPVVIEAFTPMVKNTLRGFATVRMPSGVVFHDVTIHAKNGSAWASPASKPQLDRTGQHMKGNDGKGLWLPVVTFASKEARDRFSEVVIAALRASRPDALAQCVPTQTQHDTV